MSHLEYVFVCRAIATAIALRELPICSALPPKTLLFSVEIKRVYVVSATLIVDTDREFEIRAGKFKVSRARVL